ncbi:hypothetical protein LTR95_016538 [Oleoguttula sp. CCFEE 5521]
MCSIPLYDRTITDNDQATDVEDNALYLVPVAIGTPAQTLNLDFDTGSSDLWVWSTELPSATTKNATGHTIFNPTKSSTFEKTASTWKISYGDGSSASGDVGTDTVNIGGLIIKQQAVELAKTLSSSFASGQGDGLLGLAFGTINTVTPKPVATPVENMIAQDDIKPGEELFTAFLSQPTADSFYTFGFIDQDSLAGQTPAYAPVDNSQGFWMFDSASANLNGETIARSGNKAIADTGTTLCLIDDDTLAKIYGTIPGAMIDSTQQGWVFPKSTPADSLPSVGFAVGDAVFYVQKEDLAFQDLNDGSGNVFGGIQSRGSGQDFDILGDVFLRGVYAIFDVGNTQFGATQRGTGAGTSGGSGSSGTGTGAGTGQNGGSGTGTGTGQTGGSGTGTGTGTGTGSGTGSGTGTSGSGHTHHSHHHHHHHPGN